MRPITALIMLLSVGAWGQERVLDLTRPTESVAPSIAPDRIQNCRLGGRGAGKSGGMPPYALVLQGFDKVDYSMGKPIVVDLKLTNTSDKPLHIPTVPADTFRDPFEGEEAIQFGFTVLLKDAAGEEHELTGTMLRGSTKLSDTTQVLEPRQSIRIHFPGHIPITDSPDVPPIREGQVFASLLISDGECRIWNVVRSNPVGKARLRSR
jgi:hypothetical protein